METKVKNMDLLKEGSSKLESLKNEREALTNDLYKEMDESKKLFNNLDFQNVSEAEEKMSKLDHGLQKMGDYKDKYP